MLATYQKANGSVQDNLKILFSFSLAFLSCMPRSAPAPRATSMLLGTRATSHRVGPRATSHRVGPRHCVSFSTSTSASATRRSPHQLSQPNISHRVLELVSPRDSRRTGRMAGGEAPSQLLCGGKPEIAPASPVCSPSMAGGGQAGFQFPPRGMWHGAALPPAPSSRLDFILLFQPLPPATRQPTAGASSTALARSRAFF